MRRRSFASDDFNHTEAQEFGDTCDAHMEDMKFLCASVPLCGKKKKKKNFADESVR